MAVASGKTAAKAVIRSPMRAFPLNRAFTFIEPGPVLLITTASGRRRNVMAVSCQASMGFEPTIGIMLGPWNHSYETLLQTGECVVAIPTVDMMEAVVDIGNCSGDEVDKFKHFGLTARKGKKMKAPLIAECLANIECVVMEPPRSDERHMFVLEGVAAWHNPARKERRTFHANGDGTFVIDGEMVNLRGRMTKWQHCI